MTTSFHYQARVQFRCGPRGRKRLETKTGQETPPLTPGRIPQVSRLMALAIRFEGLIHAGVVADQAELARLGHVTRARLTQIMNLLLLAPDIQETLLLLPRVEQGKDPIREPQLRPIVAVADWRKQRRLWNRLYRANTKG